MHSRSKQRREKTYDKHHQMDNSIVANVFLWTPIELIFNCECSIRSFKVWVFSSWL